MGTYRLITVEELSKLRDEQILEKVNELLVPPQKAPFLIEPADVVSAQFYMSELDRREKRRADTKRDQIETRRRRIDLGLELLIVFLIGLELIAAVGLAIWGNRQLSKDVAQELQAFRDMQVVLSHMQDTSKATADTMDSERETMAAMNAALQKQLALYYDVSVNVVFDQQKKELMFINNGRTNITIWGIKVGEVSPHFEEEGRAIAPGAGYKIDASDVYNFAIGRFPKPNEGIVPFEFYVKNERREEFVQRGYLGVHWQNDVGILNVQTASVAPEHWGQKIKKTQK